MISEQIFEGWIEPREITMHKEDYDKIIIASYAGYEISNTLNEMGFVQDIDYFILPI